MPVVSRDAVVIPIELILDIARFLQPDDIMNLLQIAKGLDQLLTFHHFAVKGENGETLLHLVARDGDENLMRMFLAKRVISPVRHDDVTRLHQAATSGKISRTRSLASTSFNLNGLDRYKATPLHWAAKQGHDIIVKILLDRDDIKPDLENIEYRTPLSFAAEHGHMPVVDLLLRQDNVNPNSKDNEDRTPLSFAAEHGHISVVELLLQQVNIEADAASYDHNAAGRWVPEDGGRTPLSFAAENGHLTVVKLLVQRDDVYADSMDDRNRSPLWWAAKHGHLAVVELLMQRDDVEKYSYNPLCDTPLSIAASYGQLAVVELLVQREDVEADSKDKDCRTPLSQAAAGDTKRWWSCWCRGRRLKLIPKTKMVAHHYHGQLWEDTKRWWSC